MPRRITEKPPQVKSLDELRAAGVRVTIATKCWGIENSQRHTHRARHGSASHMAAVQRGDLGPSSVIKRKQETRQFIKNHGHHNPPAPKHKKKNGKKTFGRHRPLPERPAQLGKMTIWNPCSHPADRTAASGTKIPTSGSTAARAVPE